MHYKRILKKISRKNLTKENFFNILSINNLEVISKTQNLMGLNTIKLKC